MGTAEEYLAHFQRRVMQDAFEHVNAQQMLERAATFDDIADEWLTAPRPQGWLDGDWPAYRAQRSRDARATANEYRTRAEHAAATAAQIMREEWNA